MYDNFWNLSTKLVPNLLPVLGKNPDHVRRNILELYKTS